MFSDLVGLTALSARMHAEDVGEVISAYQKCIAETVRRVGGFVAKYLGDSVLRKERGREMALRHTGWPRLCRTASVAALAIMVAFPAGTQAADARRQ
jgi:class 3 adenylate cyclase